MEAIPLPSPSTPDQSTFFNKVFSGAWGTPIALPAVPTGDVLNPNQWGFYGTDVFFRFSDGSKVKLTGSSWS